MRPPRLVLLASPLLGPVTWAPVAQRLRTRGLAVDVPPLPDRLGGPEDVLAGWAAALPADEPSVLVAHSNAGLYVAALADRRPVGGVLLVDAGVPQTGETPLAPAELLDALAELVDADGLLPPWTGWWDPADVDGLFPDAATRADVVREERRLPLAYFRARVPSPDGWQRLPVGYLGFGEQAYADELVEARRRGWPVEVLDGAHLHQLVDPDGVAGALLRLGGRLGVVKQFP